MATFEKPIYDRTLSDVTRAIDKVNEWIKDPALEKYDLKGCLNVGDLNRVEGNIEYLSEYLNNLHYLQNVDAKSWGRADLPTQTDIDRIINNVRTLINAYNISIKAPSLPTQMMTYSEINDIEKIISILSNMIYYMESAFPKSNTIKSGSRNMLPLAR